MIKKFFANMKIEKKIIVMIFTVLILSQLVMGIGFYFVTSNMKKYSQSELNKLSLDMTNSVGLTTKTQVEEYMKSLSFSAATGSDKVFSEVSNQLSAACEGVVKIYEDKDKLTGHILPLPEFHNSSSSSDSFSKAYALDFSTSGEDLVYMVPEYQTDYDSELYPVTQEAWNAMDDDDKAKIKNKYSVVSRAQIPIKTYKELTLLSNLDYIFKPLYKSNSNISSIYFGTPSGVFYKYSSDNSSIRFNHCKRPWYISALEESEGAAVWQGSYIAKSTGKQCITCSKAVKDAGGTVLGVCAVDMYLDDISSYITHLNLGDTGYNFIIDQKGNVVIHPGYLEDINSENLVKEKFDKNSYSELIEKVLRDKTGITNVNLDGENNYASYAPLGTTNWELVTLRETGETLKHLYEIPKAIDRFTSERNTALRKDFLLLFEVFIPIIAVLLLLIYFIFVKFSKGISAPIVRLNQETKRIGKGNFNHFIPVNSKDEVGELASSFNSMVKALKLYMENLAKTTAEKEKVHSELMIAKKIQHSMLPCIFPAFPDRDDLDIYALMDPAKEVGGDFYDFFFVDENHLAVIVADVSGKGISAALFMVIAKILISNQLQNGDSPAQALKVINDRLYKNNEAGMFVTCFVGVMDIKTGKFVYSNAGHNPPLLYRESEKKCIPIDSPHGFVLGGFQGMNYSQKEFDLYPGDIMFLYTDGVTEAANETGKLFSQDKLEQILKGLATEKMNIKDITTYLRTEIDKFSGKVERSDDITMLALKNISISPSERENLK